MAALREGPSGYPPVADFDSRNVVRVPAASAVGGDEDAQQHGAGKGAAAERGELHGS